MYKITLFDNNCPSCTSGIFCIYVDDINQFAEEWMGLERDEGTIERFLRSKNGEIVTDYYSDDPKYNIVQEDKKAEILFQKTVLLNDKKVIVYNGYGWPTNLHIMNCVIDVRYVKVQGQYMRQAKYKITGVYQDDPFSDKICQCTCFGNSMLKCHYESIFGLNDLSNRDVYQRDMIESIAYYPIRGFESMEEMQMDFEDSREDFFTPEELDWLFTDIVGDEG